MSVGRVYIVRHGNTFDKGDVILRVGGKTDLPLSSSGRLQAERLAEALQAVDFVAAYSSDLKRTRQTAETLLGQQNYRLAEFLTEIDYGPDEGLPETEVIARIGSESLKRWDEKAIPPEGWKVDVDGLTTAWKAFLASCDPRSNTLVVTSNGVARFLLDVVASDMAVPLKLRTGSYGIIDLTAKGPILVGWDIRPEP
ncbi:MAG: histidine phosphatase family protein [Litorimonas sp.]